MSSQINKVLEQIHKVPQIPKVVQVLINQFNDPDVELKDIARNIEKEQVISLKVLRLVNSAYYGLPKKMASIEEAVVFLGLDQLRTLVIASGIVSVIPAIKNFDIKAFWQHSFCTAIYAKWLAKHTQCDGNIAFTAGLINNLGTILIHLGLEKEALEIKLRVEEGHARPFAERMRLGFTTQDVSAQLCKQWEFAEELIIPVAQSAEPLRTDPVSQVACAVYAANVLCNCKHENMKVDEVLNMLPLDILAALGLSENFFREKLTELFALKSSLDGLLD